MYEIENLLGILEFIIKLIWLRGLLIIVRLK